MSYSDLLPATEKQQASIRLLARDAGLTVVERNEVIRKVTANRAANPEALTRIDAGAVIKRLQIDREGAA